jgi:hypothetical protein
MGSRPSSDFSEILKFYGNKYFRLSLGPFNFHLVLCTRDSYTRQTYLYMYQYTKYLTKGPVQNGLRQQGQGPRHIGPTTKR